MTELSLDVKRLLLTKDKRDAFLRLEAACHDLMDAGFDREQIGLVIFAVGWCLTARIHGAKNRPRIIFERVHRAFSRQPRERSAAKVVDLFPDHPFK